MEKQVLYSGRKKDIPVYIPPQDLTIQAIRKQLPDKYFQRSLFRSSAYLIRDLIQVVVTAYVMVQYGVPFLNAIPGTLSYLPPSLVGPIHFLIKTVVWNIFWFVQGLNAVGLWVLAHECGHQAFSPYKAVNDFVGTILHSALLVPYHGWRITHGNHHKHTNHLTKDTVFVPTMKSSVVELAQEAPAYTLLYMIRMFLIGFPAHILTNATGQNHSRRANHFEPSSPLFEPEDAQDIIASDMAIGAVLVALCGSIYTFGFTTVACWYLVPYLWVNFWLVFITYLQHTDLRLPHYDAKHWTFPRGALSSIDRDYGFILNTWFHHINDSHVIHHLFSQVPFYHAIELTRRYCREIFGDVYVTEASTPILKGLWKCRRECVYVVPKEGVCVFYGPTKE